MNLANRRIAAALGVAMQHAQTDGEHHKTWTIDQMVRALLGEPPQDTIHPGSIVWLPDTYQEFIAAHNRGDDGPDTYSWDEGTPL